MNMNRARPVRKFFPAVNAELVDLEKKIVENTKKHNDFLKEVDKQLIWGMQQIPDQGSDKIRPLVPRQILKPGKGRMKTDKDKKIQKSGKKETSIVRSSAAEYLTFVAASGKGGVEAVYVDENIWLTENEIPHHPGSTL